MRKIIITSVAALAVLAFAGCAEKTSCVPAAPKKACPTPVVKAAPAPVVAPAPAPVVEKAEPVVVPVVDAKEAAVQ